MSNPSFVPSLRPKWERFLNMVDRVGLSASNSASCSLDLPHSPGSQDSSPRHHPMGADYSLDSATPEDQTKSSLPILLRVEIRKEFKGLVREHKDSLGGFQPKPT